MKQHVWVIESVRKNGAVYVEASSPRLDLARSHLNVYRENNSGMKFRLAKYVREDAHANR